MRPDLRLLLPAGACWCTVAVLGESRPGVALGCALLLTLAAAAVLLRGAGGAAVLVAAGLLAAAAGLTSAGVRHLARTTGPLAQLARQGADVAVRLQLDGDPMVRDGVAASGAAYHLVLVPAQAVEVATDDGRTWALRAPLLVLATTSEWERLLPSQSVSTAGTLAPPRRGDSVTAVLDARGPPERVGPPSGVQRVAGRIRGGLRTAAARLPGQPAALLPALVDGDTGGLTTTTTRQFRATGLTHLVAVSGENLAVVTGVVLGVVRRLRLGPRATALVTALAIGGFVVLARPSPSVLRAAVMGAVALAALASGRSRPALGGLAAAVLLLVLADPSLARQAGFALSVLASLGLLVLAPGLTRRLARHLPGWLATAVAVPVAAQLACTPVIAAIGGGVGVMAVPANLLAAPAVPPATVLGVLAAVTAPVLPGVAHLLAVAGWLPCRWLVLVAQLGSQVPGATVPAPAGWSGAAVASLVLLVVWALPFLLWRQRDRLGRIAWGRRAILPR